jgi:hypothetical protein
MHVALDSQLVEHVLLVVERSHLEPGQADGHPVVLSASRGFGECIVQAVPVNVRVVQLETRVVPVGVEGAVKLG